MKPPQDAETQNNVSKHQRMMENLDPVQFLQQEQQWNKNFQCNKYDKGFETLLIMAAEPVMIIAKTSRIRNMKNSHLFFCSYSLQ